MEFLYPTFITVVLMYAWFETDAFEVYSKTFGLYWFGLGKYLSEKEEKPMFDYHTHLLMRFPSSFFVKLVTCPVCLMVWVAPLVSFLYNKEMSSSIIFREIVFAWLLFFTLKAVVKASDR
jgi:hypothetical protein